MIVLITPWFIAIPVWLVPAPRPALPPAPPALVRPAQPTPAMWPRDYQQRC